jgi:LPXTG-site transpeptidase (sortase) family protein
MLPISLTIADLGIHLDLKQGVYDARSNQWTIDDHAAYITTQSATPIIYAHNRPALFAPLRSIEAGMTMTLTWSDGATASYRYTKTRFVSPDDGQILREVNDKTIILLTCNGCFDESRRLVYFEEQS